MRHIHFVVLAATGLACGGGSEVDPDDPAWMEEASAADTAAAAATTTGTVSEEYPGYPSGQLPKGRPDYSGKIPQGSPASSGSPAYSDKIPKGGSTATTPKGNTTARPARP